MYRRTNLGTAAPVAALAAAVLMLAGSARAQYAVSQLPPLTPNPPTNVVITVDDSGSMQWAYVPDGMSDNIGTRRFNAGSFNALAYNPNIYYPPPLMITSTGQQTLSTNFSPGFPNAANSNGAWLDGFNQAMGSVDLSSNYQPTSSYAPGSTNQNFSQPLAQDVPTICSPSANCTGAPAYYFIYNASQCTSKSVNDDACYQYVRVSTTSGHYVDPRGIVHPDERANFANWYSFYRTRHLMIASAAAITMADPALTQTRVTWRDFWTCEDFTAGNTCAGYDGSIVDNKLRTFAGAQQVNFYSWLARVPAQDSTPTRSTWKYIGNYFSNTTLGANGPYGLNPNQPTTNLTSGEVACARNFNITLTDGQWNGDDNGTFFGTADANSTTLPDNVAYTPASSPSMAIYSNDSNRDTLSDVAFHYWATNLRPDLTNSATALTPYYQVLTGANGTQSSADYWNPLNDPATWPHLEQITIGIGMTSTMTASGLNWWGNNVGTQYNLDSKTNPGFVTYSAVTDPNPGYTNLWYGNAAWPSINNTATQGDMGKAYDLWHAALNSRGLAFSAESPQDLINAMNQGLNRIKTNVGAQSAVTTNSSSLNNGATVYVASYSPVDWHGLVSAYSISTTGTISATASQATTNAGTFALPGSRVIITSNTSSATASASPGPSVLNGIQFSGADTTFSGIWTALFSANGPYAASASNAANILSWLRGDVTTETQNGGNLRNRYTTVLGDIVDSGTVFAFQDNFGYASLAEGMSATPNYLTFLSTKAASKGSIYSGAGMVYVGANDGMLHGFDAATLKEVFAYVPHDLIATMPPLADPAYAHRFYVDQTAYVGDACVGTGPTSCSWKTVLVGTTGAGGQGVFALDVTAPASMESAATAVGNVLWDLDGLSATSPNGDPDLGYPIGKPIIARLNNGDWSAIFGNGYLSSRGCAVLFIVRLSDGAVTKLDTSGLSSTGTCTGSNINAGNGLGPVTLSDVNGDMTTDFVYAGDLQGNLWKFDLSAATSGSWAVAFSGQPLFAASQGCVPAATSTSPSTCQPITSAPALGPPLTGMRGTMVYFGTGRMFAVGDAASTLTQNFYAVLDQGGTAPISGGPSALVQQTINNPAVGATTRTITFNPVTPPKLGWYANLPTTGERVTMAPILFDGYIVFATEIPALSTCNGTGSSWIMAIPASTTASGGINTPNFFTGKSGAAGMQLANVGVVEGITWLTGPMTTTTTGGTGGTTSTSVNNQGTGVVGGTSGTGTFGFNSNKVTGRISWHELVR